MEAESIVRCLLDGIIRVDKDLVDKAVDAIYAGLKDAHEADTNKNMSMMDTLLKDEEFQSVTAKAINNRLKEAGINNFAATKFKKGQESPAGFTSEKGGFVLLNARIFAVWARVGQGSPSRSALASYVTHELIHLEQFVRSGGRKKYRGAVDASQPAKYFSDPSEIGAWAGMHQFEEPKVRRSNDASVRQDLYKDATDKARKKLAKYQYLYGQHSS